MKKSELRQLIKQELQDMQQSIYYNNDGTRKEPELKQHIGIHTIQPFILTVYSQREFQLKKQLIKSTHHTHHFIRYRERYGINASTCHATYANIIDHIVLRQTITIYHKKDFQHKKLMIKLHKGKHLPHHFRMHTFYNMNFHKITSDPSRFVPPPTTKDIVTEFEKLYSALAIPQKFLGHNP